MSKTEVMSYLTQIEGLKRQLSEKATAYRKLEDAFEALKAENELLRNNAGTRPVPHGGLYTYSDFRRTAQQSLGKEQGWQTQFCKQTGHTESDFNRWKKTGGVPPEVYEMAENLQSIVNQQQKHSWSAAERQRIRELRDDGHTIKEVAATLSQELGREINGNMIKGQFYNRKDA